MTRSEKPYYLFDHNLDQKSLINLAKKKINDDSIEEWEKEIFRFILQWFDEKKFIEVKTSGSTGKPKTIRLQKKYMTNSAAATLSFLKLKQADKALLCLPAEYIAGKMMIVRALTGALNLHYIKPSLSLILPENTSFSFVAFVPSMLSALIKTDRLSQLENFENIILGGSEIPVNIEENLVNLKNKIWHSYGMTETITHIALRRINGNNRSEWYRPFNGVEVSVNADEKLEISYNGIGVNNLLTNDLAVLNSTGGFKILGRADSVIISGGIKIHPEQLESKISRIIKNNFLIFGVDDKVLGQKIVMFIEGETDKSNREIKLNLLGILDNWQMPKTIIHIKEFERTASGKIIRKDYS